MRKLKFSLDRSLKTISSHLSPLTSEVIGPPQMTLHLHCIYSTLVRIRRRPLGQLYAIWEKWMRRNPNRSSEIATDATKLVSINNLYKNNCWDTLQKRWNNQKLTLFYKMYNSISPGYLLSLIPQQVDAISPYNLRNSNDLQTIRAKTGLYYNSFLPLTLRQWNNLSIKTRQLNSLNSFKRLLKEDKRPVPKYYFYGVRKAQILHTGVGMGCSSLNLDLFMKNITIW